MGREQKGEEGVRGVIPTLNSNFLLLLQLSFLQAPELLLRRFFVCDL